MWDIEENANKGRSWDWFSPPSLPTKALRGKSHHIGGAAIEAIMITSANIGPSFCQIVMIRQLIQEAACMACGNQKWKGGIPSFIKSPLAIIRRAGIICSVRAGE